MDQKTLFSIVVPSAYIFWKIFTLFLFVVLSDHAKRMFTLLMTNLNCSFKFFTYGLQFSCLALHTQLPLFCLNSTITQFHLLPCFPRDIVYYHDPFVVSLLTIRGKQRVELSCIIIFCSTYHGPNGNLYFVNEILSLSLFSFRVSGSQKPQFLCLLYVFRLMWILLPI